MKKLVVFIAISLLLIGSIWADTIHSNACASATADWTFTNVGGVAIQQGGYWVLDAIGESVVSQAFDVTTYTDLTLTFKVATYGSGTNHAAKVEYSTDGGSSWNASTFTSATPTSSTMISAGTWSLGTISSSQLKFRWTSPDGGGKGVRLDDILFSGTVAAATPLITLSQTALSGFTYEFGNGPSTEQTFTVTGANLTSDISIAASTNYEISKTSGSGYTTPLVFTQSGGVVSTQTVYVRLKSGLSIGSYINENIAATSTGAATKNVTCGGSVTSPPPPASPTANTASAVSHEGFTAHFDAVSGATSYRIDVMNGTTTAVATDLFFSEYVEGSSNNKYIEIFNGTGASVDLSSYYLKLFANGVPETSPTTRIQLSGTLANGACAVYKNSSAVLTLPVGVTATNNSAVNWNGDDAFALMKMVGADSSYVDIFGRIGEDPGTEWGTTPLWTINTTLVRKGSVTGGVTTNPSSGFPTLSSQWDNYAQDTATYLGSHTMGAAVTFVTGWNNKAVNNTVVRVYGLDPDSDYSYRVRAVNDYGTSSNSNVIEVTTGAISAGAGANTSISGASTIVLVEPLDGFTNNTVEIDPDTSTSDDITVSVAANAMSIQYTVTASDAALSGLFWLNHAGLGFTPVNCTVNDGTIVEWSSTATETFVEIADFGAKGTLIITLEDEAPLPVELSSFSAVLNSQNYVNILWVTQTETGLAGYYILRGVTEDFVNAELISPMIEPTNTSQQQHYVYTDQSVSEPGTYYYWLQVSEMDGNNVLHGPTTVNFTGQEGPGTPGIDLITGLHSVYPNPFNPSTTIGYGIAKAAEVTFSIYNARGQVVRTINQGMKQPNNYKLSWNGLDDNGVECSTGIYFIRMQAGKDSFTRKAMLMK